MPCQNVQTENNPKPNALAQINIKYWIQSYTIKYMAFILRCMNSGLLLFNFDAFVTAIGEGVQGQNLPLRNRSRKLVRRFVRSKILKSMIFPR